MERWDMDTRPSSSNTSDSGLAIQWPLPQPPSQSQPRSESERHPPLRLGVMASGNGTNFEVLVHACRSGVLHGTVERLVVNNPGCGAAQRAERLGIPCHTLDHRLQPSREALDRALSESFQDAQVDLVVMAGWMRIVTPVLIAAYPDRLVNIHPSLLPSFRGVDAVGQALDAGVRLAGCTVHLVCEEVDSGRILIQAAVPVLDGDDRGSLAARIQIQEHRILPLGVAIAAQRLRGRTAAGGAQWRPAGPPSG
ncbi:phosphoribosylglycinamide formyltransferase [Synechococcus sp. CBW1002]|nr:phosphoribosylglycinamide formyltransferase [Synechococcus sp. CBW1002]